MSTANQTEEKSFELLLDGLSQIANININIISLPGDYFSLILLIELHLD